MSINFQQLSEKELIEAYPDLLKELKSRKIIKGKNVIGDLAEWMVINHYNSTAGLPTLSAAPPGTIDFDTIGKNGKRYSIKATSGQVTGQFHGLPAPSEPQTQSNPKFDCVIIVKFDTDYRLEKIAEISWGQFLALRKWLPRQNAYNLNVSQKLLAQAKVVFSHS